MPIKAEPVGDLPAISRLLQSTGLSQRVDKHYPTHHLWQGTSIGKTLEAFLVYILSENDHRLYNVQDWALGLERTLSWLLDEADFRAAYLSDDRLGSLLDYLSKDDERWMSFQRDHSQSLIRFYDLDNDTDQGPLDTVRIDSTTAQSHRETEGIFQMGHNATGLALPQVKLMLLAMDKANLPLALNVVAGQNSDDKLYVPALEQAWKQGLKPKGVLVVGDRKLCNQYNMCFIADSGNYYLGPLAQRQYSREELIQAREWIEQQQEPAECVMRQAAGSKDPQAIALVKELPAREIISADGTIHTQRLFGVCSLNLRKRQVAQLEQRCQSAYQQVILRFTRNRGRKTIKSVEEAEQTINKILDKHKVAHLYSWKITLSQDPAQPCSVELTLDEQQNNIEQQLAGWRVMATNAPSDRLSACEVVLCYWEEYRIEQHFHLLLSKCTSLTPIFLKKENRIQAMLRILMLALQYYNLWQYTIRQTLKKEQNSYLTNLVPGNPGRKVERPTTSLVLSAFRNVQMIYIMTDDHKASVHLQGIEEHHLRLLKMMRLPPDIYRHPWEA